jgi:NitT/TauT family transport system permease protein
VGLALVGAIVGEFIGATAGLGYYIGHSASMFDTAGVFAGIFALALLAVALNEMINVVERRVLRWRPAAGSP